MSNTNPTGNTAASSNSNFLIDGSINKGTLSNVADMLDLLSNLDAASLGERAAFGMFMMLARCADAIRHVQNSLEKPLD